MTPLQKRRGEVSLSPKILPQELLLLLVQHLGEGALWHDAHLPVNLLAMQGPHTSFLKKKRIRKNDYHKK